MVDPTNIPETMTDDQIEWFILFGICVAGKSADQTTKKLNTMLTDIREIMRSRGIFLNNFYSPFYLIRQMAVERRLSNILSKYKMGQYQRIEKAMTFAAANLDVTKLTLEDLEAIPGIGPKTARMVMLYSDPTFQGVPLDTHILKFLQRRGYNGVPKSTPSAGVKYLQFERYFQREAAVNDMTVRELDTLVWKAYQSGDLSKLPGVNHEIV